MEINEYIKQVYTKRSKFIHGETKKKVNITKFDVTDLQTFVSNVLNKLIELRGKGFIQIKKDPKNKNIDTHIEELKFGLI